MEYLIALNLITALAGFKIIYNGIRSHCKPTVLIGGFVVVGNLALAFRNTVKLLV